jgi:Flp pilus assembly protein TadD
LIHLRSPRATDRSASTPACVLACVLAGVLAGGCGRGFFKPRGPSGPTSQDFYQQGIAAYRAGDRQAAVKSLAEATRRNPNFAAAHSALGDIYKQSGDHAAAATEFESAARLEPGAAQNHSRLALSYHFLNRLRDAVASYLRAVNLNPSDWKSNMNLGLAYSALGDHNAAVEHAQRATNLNPTSAVARANLGVALDARGNRVEAEAAYRRAMELDPGQTTAAQNLVANLLDQGRPLEAIDVINLLLATSDTAVLRRRYGDALAQAGRAPEAMDQYRRSLERDERYYPAMNGLAALLIQQYRDGLLLDDRKREEALALWSRSLQANPNQPRVQAQLRMWQPKGR